MDRHRGLAARGLTFARIGFRTFDAVLFAGPGAEVEALAARRAERAMAVFLDPGDALATSGAEHRARRAPGYRLHNVNSNGTSVSTWRGRWYISGPRKRMLMANLPAEISGSAATLSWSRMRTICAVRPPSINW